MGPQVLGATVVERSLVKVHSVTVTKVEPVFTAEVGELPDPGTSGILPPLGSQDKVETV